MNKSAIFSLFLMATLLMGKLLNMNMFSTAMASEKDEDDKRYQYDDDNRYQQSNYEQKGYSSSNDKSYDMVKMYSNNYDKAYSDQQRLIIVMTKSHTQ